MLSTLNLHLDATAKIEARAASVNADVQIPPSVTIRDSQYATAVTLYFRDGTEETLLNELLTKLHPAPLGGETKKLNLADEADRAAFFEKLVKLVNEATTLDETDAYDAATDMMITFDGVEL